MCGAPHYEKRPCSSRGYTDKNRKLDEMNDEHSPVTVMVRLLKYSSGLLRLLYSTILDGRPYMSSECSYSAIGLGPTATFCAP